MVIKLFFMFGIDWITLVDLANKNQGVIAIIGIGATIVTSFVVFFIKKPKKKKASQQQKLGDNSTGYQAGGDMKIQK